jgi:hypothetical protein
MKGTIFRGLSVLLLGPTILFRARRTYRIQSYMITILRWTNKKVESR